MTREDLKDIIAAQLHIDPADIAENTSITDELGADSLDIVEMLLTLEERYGIVPDDEEVIKVRTLADAEALLRGETLRDPDEPPSNHPETEEQTL